MCNCIKKGRHIVRSFQLSAVSLVTAAVVSAGSLLAVSPASAAVRPSAASTISVSGNGRPAVALRTALNHVRRTSDGQFALVSAGLSSRERSADSAFVADLNKVERQAGTLDLASDNVVDAADTVSAATTVYTILPGITLTISSTEVVLDISAQDVTDIEDVIGLGTSILSLVGSILSIAQVPLAPQIIAIIASAITVGSDVLKVCAGNDGGSVILSLSDTAGELVASACGVSV
jgi:hypothetical protein